MYKSKNIFSSFWIELLVLKFDDEKYIDDLCKKSPDLDSVTKELKDFTVESFRCANFIRRFDSQAPFNTI